MKTTTIGLDLAKNIIQVHGADPNGKKHGARSVLAHLHRREDRLGEWIKRVKERRGSCKAIVALANKLGRIVWVLMAKGEQYSVACR